MFFFIKFKNFELNRSKKDFDEKFLEERKFNTSYLNELLLPRSLHLKTCDIPIGSKYYFKA